MLSRIVIALVFTLARACAANAANAYDGLPRDFTVAASAQLLRINGVEVHSRSLSSGLAPLRACTLLQRQWRSAIDSAYPVACRREGEWVLATHRVGSRLQTAQLREYGGGSVGFLSELDPLAPVSGRPVSSLPLPTGARLVNVVQSIDQHDSVTQFTIELPLAPAAALLRLLAGARRFGWAAAAALGANVLDFQRGSIAVRAIAAPMPRGSSLVLLEHRTFGVQP